MSIEIREGLNGGATFDREGEGMATFDCKGEGMVNNLYEIGKLERA